MEISLRTKETFAELTISTGSAKIIEDLANYTTKEGWLVEESVIENFITIANDLSRFNQISDVDFVEKVIDAFLNNSEREEILEWLSTRCITNAGSL